MIFLVECFRCKKTARAHINRGIDCWPLTPVGFTKISGEITVNQSVPQTTFEVAVCNSCIEFVMTALDLAPKRAEEPK